MKYFEFQVKIRRKRQAMQVDVVWQVVDQVNLLEPRL